LKAIEPQLQFLTMNFIYAALAWILMGTVLGLGIVLATRQVNPSPWLLVIAVVGLIVAVGKIGCKTH
jgi:hypothetical protein